MNSLYPGQEEAVLRWHANTSIGWLFSDLLSFRQRVYNVTYPHQGLLEGFVASLEYGFHLQAQLKAVILDNLSEIDDTLWLILDPAQKVLRKEDIHYPEADLRSIENDYWIAQGLY